MALLLCLYYVRNDIKLLNGAGNERAGRKEYIMAEENTKTVNDEGFENSSGANNERCKERQAQSFDDVLKNKEYQSEFDRRIAKAIATAKVKWNEESQETIEAAVTEAVKLQKMTSEQKAEHERKKAEEALAKREAEITMRELKAEAKDTLVTKGLPAELADVLNYTNAEACSSSLEAVEKAFGIAVEKKVNDRLRSEPPKEGEHTSALTQDEFNKMTYSERLKLFDENKELHNRMIGGNK